MTMDLLALALLALLYIEIGSRMTRKAVTMGTMRYTTPILVTAVVAWPLLLAYGMLSLRRKNRTK